MAVAQSGKKFRLKFPGSDPDMDYHRNLMVVSLAYFPPFHRFFFEKIGILVFCVILPTNKETN